MDPWVMAYLVVWLGVVAYLARLGARQRRLTRIVESLTAEAAEKENRSTGAPPAFKAA